MDQLIHTPARGGPWNKGKLVGQKAPLRLKEIWAIRIRLQLASAYRRGYRVPYDVVPLIQRLQTEGTSEKFWEVAWQELHHQGDVGEATYAVVPYLVDYQSRQRSIDEHVFHFCVVVELARSENDNPPVPQELGLSYAKALDTLPIIQAVATGQDRSSPPLVWRLHSGR